MNRLLPLVCIPFLLGACRESAATGPIPPPKIVLGEDMCAECSMIISEGRFAGAIGVRAEGRTQHLLFDDVGEMFLYEVPAHESVRFFVHDLDTGACLDAASAFFLYSEALHTPMGTGVAAFATESGRDAALGEHGGQAVTLVELRNTD